MYAELAKITKYSGSSPLLKNFFLKKQFWWGCQLLVSSCTDFVPKMKCRKFRIFHCQSSFDLGSEIRRETKVALFLTLSHQSSTAYTNLDFQRQFPSCFEINTYLTNMGYTCLCMFMHLNDVYIDSYPHV